MLGDRIQHTTSSPASRPRRSRSCPARLVLRAPAEARDPGSRLPGGVDEKGDRRLHSGAYGIRRGAAVLAACAACSQRSTPRDVVSSHPEWDKGCGAWLRPAVPVPPTVRK